MACEMMQGKTFNFSPVQEASKHFFVPIDDISVVLVGGTIKLPENREHWPVCFLEADCIENSVIWNDNAVKLPYVLCGLKNDVLCAVSELESSGKQAPIYMVSDEPVVSKLCEDFCVPSLGSGEWEETISIISSLHVSTIPQMIVRQAKQTPEAVAVISSTAPLTLTYAQLVVQAWELSESILNVISQHTPLPANPLVGFIMPPSSLSVLTLLALGLRRIGAVVIASKPSEITEYQLRKVGCHALLVTNGQITSSAVPCVINIGDLYSQLLLDKVVDVSSVSAPASVEAMNDVGLVEWTSGSTGKPKAMAVTAWRLAHWIRWRQYHFPMTTYGDRVGVGLFWAWYWHIPLCQGGTMVVIPDEMTVDVVGMVDYLRLHQVDWVDCLTPGQLKMMAELVSTDTLPIKHVMSSGEALSISVAKAFLSRFPSTTLSNVLSTTETAADICCLKNVTLELCECLERDKSLVHVPVLESGESVVWGNLLTSFEENGARLLIRGWNIQPDGYATGEHKDSFIDRIKKVDVTATDECGCFLTGDRIVWKEVGGRRYGCVEGRVDDVVKIRGHRVDLAGVEACLNSCKYVRDAAAVSHQDTLYALVVLADGGLDVVSSFLKQHLPSSSVPTLVTVPEIEYTKTGKKARKNMVRFLPHSVDTSADLSGLDLWSEAAILIAMQQQLGVPMQPSDSFFDLGGNSFKALRVCRDCQIPVAMFFAHPSPSQLCLALAPQPTVHIPSAAPKPSLESSLVAVCGMGVRLPGANTVSELWEKLKKGEVMTSVISSQKGVVNEKGMAHCGSHCGSAFGAFGDCSVPPLVSNGVSIAGPTSLEQRVLLELSYEALQDAGFEPLALSGVRTGVFVCGGSLPHLGDLDAMRSSDPAKYFALEIGHDKDYLAASVAWALDLRGPCEVVATACSSSLVAISRAVHAIRLGLCDVALAGGASFSPDEVMAHQEGMIWAKDGCRPFCDDAGGTVPADGAAVVCLVSEAFYNSMQERKLSQYCTVEGVAVNNDGRRKGGFCQPSMAGQVEVIRTALADAGVSPNEVDYVEAHGTGTRIGDPIEIEALSQVYRERSDSACKLLVGTLKGNVGHLNTVAGVAGFVKTALCLKHGLVVPLASRSNDPHVLNTLVDWPSLPLTIATSSAIASHVHKSGSVQRATVSAFGIGGTNSCVVMSNKPSTTGPFEEPRPVLQLVESIRSDAVVSTLERCVTHSSGRGDDLAFEFELAERAKRQSRNSSEKFRSFQVVSRDAQSVATLASSTPKVSGNRPVVLVFPGQGGTYRHMGEALVQAGLLDQASFNHESNWMSSEAILQVSLAIADTVTRSLPEHKVVACVGHSFGEWVAAAYCGVVDREGALRVARLRDDLVAKLPVDPSRTPLMVSIRASSTTVSALGLPAHMSMCIVNGPMNVVVGGHYSKDESVNDHNIRNVEVSRFLAELDERSISWRLLNTTTAFHTPAVDALEAPLLAAVSSLPLRLPSIPIISSVTGTHVKHTESSDNTPDFRDAAYWGKQCRVPVRFDLSLQTLAVDYPEACVVEIGPSALVGIIKQQGFDVWPTLKRSSLVPTAEVKGDSLFSNEECKAFLVCLGNLFVHCNALPAIPTNRGSNASFPPYDFTLHQPLQSTTRPRPKANAVQSVQPTESAMYDVTWEEVEGGISVSRPAILPVLILEHMTNPSQDKRAKAAEYLEKLKLETCAENYFVVDASNMVTAAHTYGRLAIVAGSSEVEVDGEGVVALCQVLVQVIQRLSDTTSEAPLDLFCLFDSSPRYSALRGLMRSCRSECSHFRIRSVTLQSTAWYLGGGSTNWSQSSDNTCQAVLPALSSELFVSLTQQCYQPRITQSDTVAVNTPSPLVGVLAVVTGGLSGVGLNVAKHLLTSGTASHVMLVGRTEHSSVLLDEVVALGGTVVLCDVSDSVQMDVFGESMVGREVALVVHCAGVIADELLMKVTSEHCAGVLAPKVTGTLLLHKCFPTSRFVLFSSSSSTLGVVGQATYGAANAFMDEMAAQWHGCSAVQWGGWGEAGMAVAHNITPLAGERYFTTEEGLLVLDKVLSTETSPVCMALSVDWSVYANNPSVAAAQGSVLFQSVTSEPVVNPTSAGGRTLIGSSVVSYERVFGREAYMGERPDMAHVVEGEAILPATSYVSWALECVAMEHSLTNKRGSSAKQHRYRLRSCRFVKPLLLSGMHTCHLVMTGIDEVGGNIEISCGEELHATARFEWPTVVSGHRCAVEDTSGWREVAKPYEVFAGQGFDYGPCFSRLTDVKVRMVETSSKAGASAEMQVKSHVPSAGVLDSSLQLVSLCDGGVMGVPTKIELLEWFAPLVSSSESMSVTVQVKRRGAGFDLSMLDSASGVAVVSMSTIELFPLFQSHSAFTFKQRPPYPIDRAVVVSKRQHHITLAQDGMSAVVHVGACTVPQLVSLVQEIRKCAQGNAIRNVDIVPCENESSDIHVISCQLAASVIAQCVRDLGLSQSTLGEQDGVERELPVPGPSDSMCSNEERFKACCDPDGIDGVWFEKFDRLKELGSHQVEVKTSCWALNFRDVLVSRGAIPMDTNGEALGIGGECGGVVVRVGSKVKGVSVGDEVVAVPPDGMGSFVVVREELVSPPLPWKQDMLDSHSLSAVATDMASKHSSKSLHPSCEKAQCERVVSQTLVYATAWLALEWQARVQTGDVVLVHSAAGGVGLAAIFLLQKKNCIIYATASTQEKRDILKSIGCEGVFDSRDVAGFTGGIQTAEELRTGCERDDCVDVVLNSLTGDAVTASLSLLRAFGRFVELGKRSSFEGDSLSMRPFLKGLSFSAAHVDVLMLERLPLAARLLQEVWAALPYLPVLPQAWFAMRDIGEALDYMAKGVHVGKISILNGAQIPTRDTLSLDSSLQCLRPVGPHNDPVAQSLKQHPLFISGGGTVAAIPGMLSEQSAAYLTGVPEVVFAEYSCVAALARCVGVRVVVELNPWQPIHALGCQQIQRMLSVVGDDAVHLVAVMPSSQQDKTFDRAELQEWMKQTVSHISGTSDVDVQSTFDMYGVDSLAQITLARRISAQTGVAAFSVGDLMRNPTIASTLDHLKKLLTTQPVVVPIEEVPKSVVGEVSGKSRVLCFHGFRSSGELLEVALNSLFRHLSSGCRWQDFVELEFVTAPHDSSGPTDPDIPAGMPTFEWWCGDDKTYEDGWTLLGDVGQSGKLEKSRSHILNTAKGTSPVVGLIGFSQGAAMACHMAARGDFASLEWVACFSAVPPSNIDKQYVPSNSTFKLSYDSFHCYDEEEEHAWLCRDVVGLFSSTSVVNHTDGHAIPKQAEVADKFLQFISRKNEIM